MCKRKIVIVYVILISFLVPAKSWNNCEQTAFCKRIRSKTPDSNGHILNLTTLENHKTSVAVDLTDVRSQSVLLLLITHIETNTIRVVINDKNSLNLRHQVPEALNGEPKTKELQIVNISTNQATLKLDNTYIILHSQPFLIEIYSGDNLTAVLNSRSLLTFEKNEPNVGIALDIAFPGSQRAYGIPEHAEHLSLRNTEVEGLDPYRLYNIDHGGYLVNSTEALYGAIPVLYAHSITKTSGVFWLNSAQTWVDINNSNNTTNAYFISESGTIDLFLLLGPTLEATVKQYVNLTGTAPLPQYFTLGYHQSRYSYMTQEEVKNVVEQFDAHDLPLDVVWLDIDYTDNKKYFTWDSERYSQPLELQEELSATGRKLVAIIDPHFKREKGYFVHDEALEKGYYVKTINGSVYEGKCWPGLSSYIDFLNPQALQYYSNLYSFEHFKGSTEDLYIWNDMNEPSVFESEELTMPGDLVHHGGWKHRDIHNIYGFYQTIGTFSGLLNRSKNKIRPFILTRSHFAGSQRYAGMWTGDNQATWDYLTISIPMCLTQALAGMSFCGADVGGFGGIPDDELYQRWYQAGAWLPFYRAHSAIDVPRREPYLYSEDIKKRVRDALQQRYAHLPTWYTLWYEHERNGDPVILPLTYSYSSDPHVLDIDNHLLVGLNILVRPITEKGISTVQVYLPGGSNQIWYNIDEGFKPYRGVGLHEIFITLDSVPVFYRGGSIISKKERSRRSSTHTHNDPYTLIVCLDDTKTAKGRLYVDDFSSFNYRNGEYLYVNLLFENYTLSVSKIDEDANYGKSANISTIVILQPPQDVTHARLFNQIINEDYNISFTKFSDQLLTMQDLNLQINTPFQLKLV